MLSFAQQWVSEGLQVAGEAGLTSWVALIGPNVVPDVKVAPEDTLGDSGMSLLVRSVIVILEHSISYLVLYAILC